MCDPISFLMTTVLPTALSVGGGLLSASGKAGAGIADDAGAQVTASFMARSAEIQAGGADLILANVPLLQRQAEVIRDSGEVARARSRLNLARVQDEGDAVAAAQVASFTSRHIDPTTGSPLLFQLKNASQVQGDMELISATAEIERANLRMQAANLDVAAAGEAGKGAAAHGQAATTYGQSLATLMKGSAARTAGRYGAATALLSTGANVFKGFGGLGGFKAPGITIPGFNPIAGVAMGT